MTNAFKFQIQEREITMLDNPDSWGLVAAFVVEHPQDEGCARPNYMRVTMGYSHKVMNAVGTDTWFGELVTWIYRMCPILIGSKAILCATCQNIGFVSSFQEKLWRASVFLTNAETTKMLILHSDVGHIPHDKREKLTSDS